MEYSARFIKITRQSFRAGNNGKSKFDLSYKRIQFGKDRTLSVTESWDSWEQRKKRDTAGVEKTLSVAGR
jgi:hypothetical protein